MGSVLEKYLFLLGSQRGYAFTPEVMGMAIPAIAKPARRAEESSLPTLSDFSLLIRANREVNGDWKIHGVTLFLALPGKCVTDASGLYQ